MKLAMITVDLTTLAIIMGAALNLIPAIAGVLAVVYYGFLIFDRVRYGPQVATHRRDKDG